MQLQNSFISFYKKTMTCEFVEAILTDIVNCFRFLKNDSIRIELVLQLGASNALLNG